MSNRDSLHRLVDTLPEAALESAESSLEAYQTWPPQFPSHLEKPREKAKEYLERIARDHGVVGSSFGNSSFNTVGDGSASMTWAEGETFVKVEYRVFRGCKLELEERLGISPDKKSLVYSQKIKGPTGKEDAYRIEFDVCC